TLLVAEHLPTNIRVKPIGADDEVERAWLAASERDLDAVGKLSHRFDSIPEDHLDARCLRHQDSTQGAAHDLEVVADSVAEVIAAHSTDDVAVPVDEECGLHLRACRNDLVMDSRAPENLEGAPAHVDLVTPHHQGVGSLDNGRHEPVAPEPVGRRQPGGPGSG